MKKSNVKEGFLTCKFKKKTSLEKHITIKHKEPPCKECKEKLSYFTELLKHIAKHHCKEQSNVESEDDAIIGKRDALEEEKDDKVSSFVFGESMLDKFL